MPLDKVRPHQLEMATIGDEVYYKDKNDEWRGPGRDRKVVIVKQGGSLRGPTSAHYQITRKARSRSQ